MARFYLTGRIAVEGSAVLDQSDLPGRHGRLALVKLVLERHRPVPADELAAALWDHDPPPSWDPSLRAVVSKVRTALGTAVDDPHVTIAADAGCYQARLAGAWVDVEVAPNEVDRAEGSLRDGDLKAAWSHATVAAAIAKRPLLPGEDATWVSEARGRLRGVHVRALSVLTEVFRERGNPALAVSVARELVGLEPFREAGHRALMLGHLAAGDRAEAVRAYEACRGLLRDELGVDPAPETTEVYVAAMRADEHPSMERPVDD